jgi:hypothetical protein
MKGFASEISQRRFPGSGISHVDISQSGIPHVDISHCCISHERLTHRCISLLIESWLAPRFRVPTCRSGWFSDLSNVHMRSIMAR